MSDTRCARGPVALMAMLLVALTACGAADPSESSPPLDSERPPTGWTAVPAENAGDAGPSTDDDAASRPRPSERAVTGYELPR